MRSCWTGLWTILIVTLLSQKTFIGDVGFSLSSFNIIWIHRTLHIPSAIALYSSFALDLATTFCFLLLNGTRFSRTKVHYIDAYLLSVMKLAQFAFVYTSICICLDILNRTHFFGAVLIYSRTNYFHVTFHGSVHKLTDHPNSLCSISV